MPAGRCPSEDKVILRQVMDASQFDLDGSRGNREELHEDLHDRMVILNPVAHLQVSTRELVGATEDRRRLSGEMVALQIDMVAAVLEIGDHVAIAFASPGVGCGEAMAVDEAKGEGILARVAG